MLPSLFICVLKFFSLSVGTPSHYDQILVPRMTFWTQGRARKCLIDSLDVV